MFLYKIYELSITSNARDLKPCYKDGVLKTNLNNNPTSERMQRVRADF